MGVSIPNIDDANQIMLRFLEWDIIKKDDNYFNKMNWPVNNSPGLGFILDNDAIKEANKLHIKYGMH